MNITIKKLIKGVLMKRFNELDEGFICEHCGKEVTPAGYTSRDHCP